MDRIVRSFELVGQSVGVLLRDPELMVLPLLSGLCMVATVAAVAFGFEVDPDRMRAHPYDIPVPVFVMFVALYAIGIFFQAAVVAGAAERVRGGSPSLLSALAAAARRIVPILMWALLAATVGMALRLLAERSKLLGKLVAGLAGLVWSLATFFVVPVLVLEDVTFGELIGRSSDIVSETWGESLAGGVGLGAAAAFAWLGLVGVSLALTRAIGEGALFVCAGGAVCLAVLFSTLDAIFLASLYLYATEQVVPEGFDRATLKDAFVRKGR